MFDRHTTARVNAGPGRGIRCADRRSRPLTLAQEMVFLGIVFAVGLLLDLAVILRVSAVIG